ncbi:MAG: helix-turn-helix domain-containing protein, partial [Alteraurantiacibacter sp.]
MGPLPPHQDDRVIWDMWESQFRLPVATVADEVGTFRALGDRPLTTAELASELGLDERALGIHLGALAASDLIEKRDGKWRALPPARTWL